MEWPRAILPQDLANLPIRRYEGELRLVASADALERELPSMRRERVLGFDTETRPAFRKGEAYPPSLVQLAGEGVVWILQLPRVDGPARLKEIFEAPDIVKAGVGVAEDLRQLKKLVAFDESAAVDVGALARRRGIEQTGLRNLAGIVLGFRIPKGKRTSNWAAAQLTRQQIAYAAMDAWAARALYLALAQ
jgi:ribonuclease D